MRVFPLLAVLALLPAVPTRAADDAAVPPAAGPTAADLLHRAVQAQGTLTGDLRDVTLSFQGEVAQQGSVNTIRRTYWYRAGDRSFRVRTANASTDAATTDRGVYGRKTYWERASSGAIRELHAGNRDDADALDQIAKERRDFERILRMVLLSRLDDGSWLVERAAAGTVRLAEDMPYNAKGTLADREKETYHVLDLTREGEPRLRLFIRTADFSVRKAVQFRLGDGDEEEWTYYFGPFWRDPEAGLSLPRFFSVYKGTPTEDPGRSREDLLVVKGEPTVRVNTGLTDDDLKPAE